MIECTLLVAMAILWRFPDSVAGQVLHRWTVAAPASLLGGIERRHFIFLILLLALSLAGEAVLMMGSADMAVIFAWDISAYIDLIIAGWTVATAIRAKSAIATTGARTRRIVGRTIRPRAARTRKTVQRTTARRPAANDQDGPDLHALAVA
ncbi:hypothetical protein [Stakelama saccharophila]|uniref:Uncharacterized protein n=1 Tax=Stakelama saccharophila TaxID=3075605 RepID=A0ABZ0B902_9SPHN|nr:hypothetical protein [Stakelama sp. W311]WNO53902.1 hypothetical protein RPR59_01180 [Stakelama sp. W311]